MHSKGPTLKRLGDSPIQSGIRIMRVTGLAPAAEAT